MKPILVFNRTLHKELWNWLAENPGNCKLKWPGWKHIPKDYAELIKTKCSECFACYTANFRSSITKEIIRDCSLCPLEWGTKTGICFGEQGLYAQWADANDDYCLRDLDDYEKNRAVTLARRIADLPVREPEGIALVVI